MPRCSWHHGPTVAPGPLVCRSEDALSALGQKGLEQTWISNKFNFQALQVDLCGEAGSRGVEGVKLKGVRQEIDELLKVSVWDIYAFSYIKKRHF